MSPGREALLKAVSVSGLETDRGHYTETWNNMLVIHWDGGSRQRPEEVSTEALVDFAQGVVRERAKRAATESNALALAELLSKEPT